MKDQVQKILEIADDELILGWRNSEWTGIAPLLEEDVAFSSIAQNEIGHARALYELAAADLGTTADELAFDRSPQEYRCSRLVELRLVPDWAATIARQVLYEELDEERISELKSSDDPDVAGLAGKIDREVDVADERVHVAFTPTFLGCPALEVMRDAIAARISALGAEPDVEVVSDDSWSTDRITPEGREKLREHGFAPPAPREAGAPRLVQL